MKKVDVLNSITIVFKDGLEVEVEDTDTKKYATDAVNAFENKRMIAVPTSDGCIIKAYSEAVRYIKVCTDITANDYVDNNCDNI